MNYIRARLVIARNVQINVIYSSFWFDFRSHSEHDMCDVLLQWWQLAKMKKSIADMSLP